jgi:TolB-like protein
MGFISALKERRIYRIAIAYLGLGWGALEVADQLADRGIIPELVYHLILIWFLMGIPAVLLIGWHHGEKGRQKAPLSEMALLLMLVVMATGWSASTVSREFEARASLARAENPLEQRTIAVTYFNDLTADSALGYLADGLTESLIVELSQVQGLSVISRNGMLTYRGETIPPDSLARVFGAGTVVEGDVEQRGRNTRINLRIVEGVNGSVWRRGSFEVPAEQALAARDSIAELASRLLREWLRTEVRVQQSLAGTRNTAAWSLLQRGEKARKDADEAIASGDPERAAALFASADSLFSEAAALDEQWPEPAVSRAALAYRQARLAQRDPPSAVALVGAGVRHADEALRRSNTEARAFEMRGTLNYYRQLLRVAEDAGREQALVQSARSDLTTAIRFDPLLASAHATLSHLYAAEGDINSAVLAAQTAYQTDMYLESAELVLWRLFNGLLEQGSFVRARSWCNEGLRRFPDDYRLASCELRLMITPEVEQPDVDSAWATFERVQGLVPEPRREGQRVRNEMIVAGVIGRVARQRSDAALADSARAVLNRATAAVTPALDPGRETLPIAAFSWIQIGDHDRAIATLQQHAAADPQFYASTRGEATSWWWREVQSDPRFIALTRGT